MVNYKGQKRIKISGIELPISGVPYHLTEQTVLSTGSDAMYYNSAVYSVATGKTFYMVGIRYQVNGTGGGTITIHQGDTEDATTSQKRIVDIVTALEGTYEAYLNETKITSGKFITITPSTATIHHIEIIGYEA